MVKVAIIGLGWWGRHMVKCVQSENSGYQLVKAIDVNVATVRRRYNRALAHLRETLLKGVHDD